MARVGIGVPVHNGGPLLREALECLRTQDFKDFEVVIGDNASTDETAEVCAEFVAQDKRFRYIRHAENIGLFRNFVALREAVDTPLFMWRAHDDLSDPNYLSELVALFDAAPATRLAVAQIDAQDMVRGTSSEVAARYCAYRGTWRILGVMQQLFACHPSWLYGLWDRRILAEIQDAAYAAYPHPWASDHLMLFPMILDGSVRGTNATRFLQRITAQSHQPPDAATLRRLHAAFAEQCRTDIARRDWSFGERLLLRIWLLHYCDLRTFHRSWLARMRRLLLRRGARKLGRMGA